MAISATLLNQLTVVETFAAAVAPAAAGQQVTHDDFNQTKRLKASGGDVVGDTVSVISQALTAGAHTVDLTALPGTNGATINATGKKVKAILFVNPTGNAAMTWKFGASNPYLLGGDAAWRKTLPAGGSSNEYYADANAAVSGTVKTIDVSGTTTQIFQMVIVLGT